MSRTGASRSFGTFAARFPTGCAACQEAIDPGDVCRFDFGVVIHAECETVAAEPTTEVCLVCWQAIAMNGVCECGA